MILATGSGKQLRKGRIRKRTAEREALLVAIATGEQALKDAKDDETKAALESDIAAKREQLAALGA